jgi:hypothetical protein
MGLIETRRGRFSDQVVGASGMGGSKALLLPLHFVAAHVSRVRCLP